MTALAPNSYSLRFLIARPLWGARPSDLFALLFVLLGLLFGQLAHSQSEAQKTIVVLGDSITAGYGLSPEQAFPALLQEKISEAHLPYRVLNAGVSGDTSAGGLRRIDWVLRQSVDVCIIALGGNDALRGLDTVQTKNNLEQIVDKIRNKNPKAVIILAGMKAPPNLGRDFTESFEGIYKDIERSREVIRIPFLLEGVAGEPKLNQADGIHPTAEGQRIVSEQIWPTLRAALVALRAHGSL